MGNTAILIGAVALGTALICLFLGYRWGRSNVRSQVEDALDMARVSADAREFALREQLDEKMLELGEVRARAEEVILLQAKLEQLRSSKLHNSPSGSVAAEIPENENTHNRPEQKKRTAPVAGSAEKTMQKFLRSNEQKSKQLDENQDALPEKSSRLPVTKFPVKFPHSFTPQNTMPEPVKSPALKPVPAINNDEWDEFAKSLAALKDLQK
jgi:hypothetical protein